MSKKNLILGGILIILLAGAYLYKGPLKEWRENLGQPENILSGLDMAQVSIIEISKREEQTILEKIGERWKIGGTKEFYVKDDIMAGLTSALEEAENAAVEIVSENKGNKLDFEADEVTGTLVRLKQGENVIMEFVVGKPGSDFASAYITGFEIDTTYLIKTNISSELRRSDWYDRTIFETDKEKISKIRLQYPTSEFTVEKNEAGEWSGILPYKFEVDEEKIKKVIDIMSSLSAAEIPEQTFEGTGLEKHSIIIQASGDELENVLMVGDMKEGDAGEAEEDVVSLYYAKSGNSDNIYLITEEQRNELDKRIRDLR